MPYSCLMGLSFKAIYNRLSQNVVTTRLFPTKIRFLKKMPTRNRHKLIGTLFELNGIKQKKGDRVKAWS